MKKCFLVIAMLCMMIFSAQAQEEQDDATWKSIEIFQCLGLKRLCGDVWLDFTYISQKDSKKLEHIYILPEQLIVKNDHELKMPLLKCKIDSRSPNFMDSAYIATLYMNDRLIAAQWVRYLHEAGSILTICVELRDEEIKFVDGIGVALVVDIQALVPRCGDGDELSGRHTIRIICNIEKIKLQMSSSVVNEKTQILIPNGFAIAHQDKKNPVQIGMPGLVIDAPSSLTIFVSSQEELEKWQKKLDEWQGLPKPHFVLPPALPK